MCKCKLKKSKKFAERKIFKTSSYFTYIIEDKNTKFVRQYKRPKNKIYGYPRTIPIQKMMMLINKNGIPAPHILRNKNSYIDEEFICGELLTEEYDKALLEQSLISLIINLNNIDFNKIIKYVKWKTNSQYLYFLVTHLLKVSKNFSERTLRFLAFLNINLDILKNFYYFKLDDDRNLTLIHGDLHYGNLINSSGKVVVLDWELATIGDLAYELATCFLLLKFTQKQRNEFIKRLSSYLTFNQSFLKEDILVYKKYECLRKVLLKSNQVVSSVDKGIIQKNLQDFYKSYKIFAKYFNINLRSFNDVVVFLRKSI